MGGLLITLVFLLSIVFTAYAANQATYENANGSSYTNGKTRYVSSTIDFNSRPISQWFAKTYYGTPASTSNRYTRNRYTLAYNGNGGSLSGTTSWSLRWGQSTSGIVIQPSYSRSNYTFTGYSPSVPSTMPTNNVTIYAQAHPNNVTLHFNCNGGQYGPPDQVIAWNDTGYYPYGPDRDGYVFTGWYTSSYGGSEFSASTRHTSDTTYYAHWRVKYPECAIRIWAYNSQYTNGGIIIWGDGSTTEIPKSSETLYYCKENRAGQTIKMYHRHKWNNKSGAPRQTIKINMARIGTIGTDCTGLYFRMPNYDVQFNTSYNETDGLHEVDRFETFGVRQNKNADFVELSDVTVYPLYDEGPSQVY